MDERTLTVINVEVNEAKDMWSSVGKGLTRSALLLGATGGMDGETAAGLLGIIRDRAKIEHLDWSEHPDQHQCLVDGSGAPAARPGPRSRWSINSSDACRFQHIWQRTKIDCPDRSINFSKTLALVCYGVSPQELPTAFGNEARLLCRGLRFRHHQQQEQKAA